MNAYTLLPLLPMDVVHVIQQWLEHNAVNTIIRSYYRKTLIKIKLTEYFCYINHHIYQQGYYKIYNLPTFCSNLRLVTRFINENDDISFWWTIYLNIQKTLHYDERLLGSTIFGKTCKNTVTQLVHDLRLALGGELTYYSSLEL